MSVVSASRPEDARSVAFLRENSSGLLRASDGTRRLVRMHRAYHQYRNQVKAQPYGERSACEAVPWPESSDAVCWYCRRGFSGVPYKIPRCRNLDGSLTVYGNFCCLACMVKYMWLRKSLTSPEQLAIVTQLARECGVEGRLPMAPDLEDLEESGGDLSWDEFDRLCHINCARVSMRFPPMVEAMVGIEETYDAIKSGGAGMETILKDVFGVPAGSSARARSLAYTFEQTLASQEQMFLIRRNPKTPAAGLRPAASMTSDSGAQERRLMSLMNEPSTIDLDNLQPPTQEEIRRRLDANKGAVAQHAASDTQPSLFEQYVKDLKDRNESENTKTASGAAIDSPETNGDGKKKNTNKDDAKRPKRQRKTSKKAQSEGTSEDEVPQKKASSKSTTLPAKKRARPTRKRDRQESDEED